MAALRASLALLLNMTMLFPPVTKVPDDIHKSRTSVGVGLGEEDHVIRKKKMGDRGRGGGNGDPQSVAMKLLPLDHSGKHLNANNK